ncbi:MAG: hypothetical protein M1292_08450 [Bacteroidetes bacterium]|jgi:hypothetical protein|nr:hypothetical protein [Bacteroidota bacterium]
MYKLFVGFRKLREFDSIYIAKQFAQESGITGAFNLIGTNGYRDSWYIFPARKEDSDMGIKSGMPIEVQ